MTFLVISCFDGISFWIKNALYTFFSRNNLHRYFTYILVFGVVELKIITDMSRIFEYKAI